jgi:hypothetical protein
MKYEDFDLKSLFNKQVLLDLGNDEIGALNPDMLASNFRQLVLQINNHEAQGHVHAFGRPSIFPDEHLDDWLRQIWPDIELAISIEVPSNEPLDASECKEIMAQALACKALLEQFRLDRDIDGGVGDAGDVVKGEKSSDDMALDGVAADSTVIMGVQGDAVKIASSITCEMLRILGYCVANDTHDQRIIKGVALVSSISGNPLLRSLVIGALLQHGYATKFLEIKRRRLN